KGKAAVNTTTGGTIYCAIPAGAFACCAAAAIPASAFTCAADAGRASSRPRSPSGGIDGADQFDFSPCAANYSRDAPGSASSSTRSPPGGIDGAVQFDFSPCAANCNGNAIEQRQC